MKTGSLVLSPDSLLRRYALLALVWCVLLGGSLAWNLQREGQHLLAMIAIDARAIIEKDIVFQKWVNSHGGVYVSPTEHTPANPWLVVPDRDVVTTSGKNLTLMNHAYALRQMQADFSYSYGAYSRISSLDPLNPANAADEWESKALKRFVQGAGDVVEVQKVNGQPFLRMMQPYLFEPECLKCHNANHKEGDVRGGISTSISLQNFIAHRQIHTDITWLSHGVIWLIGVTALGFAYRRDRRVSAERHQFQQMQEQQLDELQRFQKLTVGRELRMKELADENAELHRQIDAAPPGNAKS
ncbi:MAG: DUF3365 domain-containing protein [Sideroxydans sp.]|jgi:hypothetical protein